MGLKDFLVTKLLGYDILKEKENLEVSLGNAQRSMATLSKQNKEFQETIEAKKQEISKLTNSLDKKVGENEKLCASLNAKQIGINQLNGVLSSKDEKIAALSKKEESLKASLTNAQRTVDTLTQQNKNLQDVVCDKDNEISKLSNHIKQQSTENTNLTASVNAKFAEVEKLTKTLNTKNHEVETLSEKVTNLNALGKSKQETIMNHVKKINALSAEVEELKQKAEQYNLEHEELVQLREDNDSLRNLKNSLEAKCEEVQNEKDALQGDNNKLVDQIASLEQEIANTPKAKPEDIRLLESQIQKNEETIQAKSRDIERLNSEKDGLKSQFDDVCKELKNVRSERDTLSERYSELEKQNKAVQDKYNDLSKECAILQKRMESLKSQLKAEKETSQPEVLPESGEAPETTETSETEETPNIGKTLKTQVKTEETQPAPKETVDSVTNNLHPGTSNYDSETIEEKKAENTPTKKRVGVKKVKAKTKEEDAIEQSDGKIVDFPLIVNDSNKKAHRTIEYVFDENNNKIYADDFFEKSAEEIAQVSRKLSEAEISGQIYWSCGLCHRRVKIAHRTYGGTETLFFIHAKRDQYCPWLTKSTSSNDSLVEDTLLENEEVQQQEETLESVKPKSRELKEKIYSLLTSQTSIDAGISEVKMDEVIGSNVPYMRWRRPDISFVFNGKKMIIELQKKSHSINSIVDRDIFFRLNNIQILWIFGSDSDSSYDYMRMLNYKNTMFDNHRNVFVFDKEAQAKSEEEETLFLKCNWLNENDSWHFRIENSGTNGTMVGLKDLTFDDEYCKPYYYDANEEYFSKHPEARNAYLATKMTREELKQSIEGKWTRDAYYEEAQVQMRQRNSRASLFSLKGLWGFRFNTTIIIPPIFTVEPKDLYNGYYLVQQGKNFGIVNYYGEKVVSWDGLIQCEGMDYDSSNKLIHFKRNGLWGIADTSAKDLIPPTYQSIVFWTNTIYKVQKAGQWGLCNIKNELICDCIYNKIENVINDRALVTKPHPTIEWMDITGYIDLNGNEIYTSKSKQNDDLYIVQKFELWGIIDENDNVVIPCQYEDIAPWAEHLYRVKENGKWGIFNVETQKFLLDTIYNSIGDIQNGVARTVFAKTESAIDVTGKEVAQVVIQLQQGLRKTKVAGKWGVINANDEVVVNHQYDEIGSFRSRMIGVINGRIIKLDANYEYPIYISGKYTGRSGNCHFFNIAGVKCLISEGFLRQSKKAISQLCDNQKVCNQLAFANLLFSKQAYSLRVLKQECLTKKLSHADGKDDFPTGEILSAKITSFKVYIRMGGKRRTKAMVEFPDGKESMVPRRFFKSTHTIDTYNIGDTLLLKKTGYDDELDQTVWEVQQ